MEPLYRKFAFPSQEVFYQLMDDAGLRVQYEEEYSWNNCAVYELLGKHCISRDENGVCTEEDPRHGVDIIFTDGTLPAAFEPYIIWVEPDVYQHIFGGYEGQYRADFCQANPDSPFCVVNEPAAEPAE